MQINQQKHSRQKPALFVVLILLLTLVIPVLMVAAENESDAKAQAETVVQEPGESPQISSADPAGEPQAGQQPPTVRGDESEPLKEFIPSEEIGADSAVAFPVDI